MNKQAKGMALLISSTTLMLISFLLMSSSYKKIYFNSETLNNELLYKQRFWQAEGGLSCALGLLQSTDFEIDDSIDDAFFSQCNNSDESLFISIKQCEESNIFKITSAKDNIRVQSKVMCSISDALPVTNSGLAPLMIYGDIYFMESDGDEPTLSIMANNGCTAIETKTDFKWAMLSQSSDDGISEEFYIRNYSSIDKDECPSYIATNIEYDDEKKTTHNYKVKEGQLGTDVTFIDSNEDAFYRVFGQTYETGKESIKNSFDVVLTGSQGYNCIQSLLDGIDKNQTKFWIEADCNITNVFTNYEKGPSNADFLELAEKSKQIGGIFVYVDKDYTLALDGWHYDTNYSKEKDPNYEYGNVNDGCFDFNATSSSKCPIYLSHLYGTFMQYGEGKLIIEQISIHGVVINGSGSIEIGDATYISYNEGADFTSNSEENSTNNVSLIKGSWNDLN